MQSVQEKYKNLQEYLKSLGSVAHFCLQRQRKHLVRIM